MNVITHHCGICGEEMNIPIAFKGCRIQFIVPPCKTCYDEAILQGEAKAIANQILKGEDMDANMDNKLDEHIKQAIRKPVMDHERIEIDKVKGAKPTQNKNPNQNRYTN